MKKSILLVFILSSINSCKDNRKNLVSEADYSKFLQNEFVFNAEKVISNEVKFWSKKLERSEDVIAQVKLASALFRKFELSGNTDELDKAENLYRQANNLLKTNSSDGYRYLAWSAMTKHEFRQALNYLDSALVMGDNRYQTCLLIFDAALEAGDRQLAWQSLQQLGNENRFDVLVRRAKWEDEVNGDLYSSIELMEQAAKLSEEDGQRELIIWSWSNLADQYCHAGQYQKAYETYLKVMEIDQANEHCLKGIAWLAFSKDKNIRAAKSILMFINQKHPTPEIDLQLAEIASYSGDKESYEYYLSLLRKKYDLNKKSGMYDSYFYTFFVEHSGDIEKALRIAQKEVSERPTPQSFSQLAFAYYLNGNNQLAVKIARDEVEGRSVEPVVLYQLGLLYKTEDKKKSREFLEEALDGAFELGPMRESKIRKALEEIM